MEKIILHIAESRLCCGCENCLNVCTHNAITMELDAEGFIYPQIDETKCCNCGACYNHCPIVNYKKTSLGKHDIYAFSCYLKNNELLLKSASGGLGSNIMLYGKANNFHVFGVKYSEDYKSAYYSEMQDADQIDEFRGTKYVQGHKEKVFKTIKQYLKLEEKCIVIGLPCDIGALKCFLDKEYENLYTVELICHGAGSEKALAEYIDRKSIASDSIVSFNMRYKKKGWTPPYIRIEYKKGKEFCEMFDCTAYGYSFRNFSRPSCYDCRYKGNDKCADITIGDYWGADKQHACWNKNGVSVCLVHNEKGKELFEGISPNFYIFPITYDEAVLNNSLINQSRPIGIREKYAELFRKTGIYNAMRKTETTKEKIIRILRKAKYFCIKDTQ